MVLGPIQVEENGETVALRGRRQRAVLALLLLDAGRSFSIDRIASGIWPDQPPEDVRDSLYTYISQLRNAIGKDRIVRSDGGYRLDLGDIDEIDAEALETAAKNASRLLGSDPKAACHLLESVLGPGGVDLMRASRTSDP